jgi:hypothetical protein
MTAPEMTLGNLRRRLVGVRLTQGLIASLGISARNKGKWGLANELLAGLTASPSKAPDLPDGELKTTVCDVRGQFREAIKVCLYPGDPLRKLEHLYLVIAEDHGEALELATREVENRAVLSLRPTPQLHWALMQDCEALDANPATLETEFLVIRPAGTKASGQRAYYLKRERLWDYVRQAEAAAP